MDQPSRDRMELTNHRMQPVSRSLKAPNRVYACFPHRVPDVLVVPWRIALVVPMEREVGSGQTIRIEWDEEILKK